MLNSERRMDAECERLGLCVAIHHSPFNIHHSRAPSRASAGLSASASRTSAIAIVVTVSCGRFMVRQACVPEYFRGAIDVVKLTPISDKSLRIEKLSPYLYSGRLRFSRRVVGAYYSAGCGCSSSRTRTARARFSSCRTERGGR